MSLGGMTVKGKRGAKVRTLRVPPGLLEHWYYRNGLDLRRCWQQAGGDKGASEGQHQHGHDDTEAPAHAGDVRNGPDDQWRDEQGRTTRHGQASRGPVDQ